MRAITLVIVGRALVALSCAIASATLAYEGKEGWGWFLFAAIWLGAVTMSESGSGKSEVA